MRVYSKGDTVEFTYQYLDSGTPVLTGNPVLITIQLGNTIVLDRATMTVDAPNLQYTYSWVVPMTAEFWEYSVHVEGEFNTVPFQEWLDSFLVGYSYVSYQDILNTPVGFDFSTYSQAQLETLAEIATDMINNYLNRDLLPGRKVKQGETTVTAEGYVYIKAYERPILEVYEAKIRVPWSAKIDLEPSYFELFKQQGYMYYPIRTAFATSLLNYPTIVVGSAEKLIYEIDYEVGWSIPWPIKYATVMALGNLLLSDFYLNSTGAPSNASTVDSFTSGKYTVNYGSNSNTMGMKDTGNWDRIITPDIMAILKKYKSIGQNTFT